MSMYLRISKSLTACLLICLPEIAAAQQDLCRDVLVTAGKDLIVRRSSVSTELQVKDWFCSDKFEETLKKRDGSFKIGIPIEGVPIEFGATGSSQNSRKAREQFCSNSSKNFTYDAQDYIYSNLVNEAAVKAWSVCMAGRAAPPAQIVKAGFARVPGAKQFALSATFDPPSGVTMPEPKITRLLLTGATCTGGDLAAGKLLKREGNTTTCSYNPKKGASALIVNTGKTVFLAVPPDLDNEKAGMCTVTNSVPVESWEDQGCAFESAAFTADLHCRSGCEDHEPKNGVNWPIAVGAGENEQVGAYCSATCSPVRGDGCPFTRVVSTTNTAKLGSGTVRSWGEPVTYVMKWKKLVRKVTPKDEKGAPFEIRYARSFSIDAPVKADKTIVECEVGGNKVSLQAGDTENAMFTLVEKATTAEKTVYTYRLR